jgi:hypothetical protein
MMVGMREETWVSLMEKLMADLLVSLMEKRTASMMVGMREERKEKRWGKQMA